MMRHPMHLHGHDFRVLNGQGEYAPMKNIIDIMPMERDTIEFAATESGDWFFHCHILYHMMSGMGRVFGYENSPANPEIPDPKYAQRKLFSDDREFHSMASVGIESNGSDGIAMLANTRWKLQTMWHLGYHDEHGYESETMIGRYLGRMQWWYPYAGFDYHYKTEGGPKNIFGGEDKNGFGQKSNKLNRKTVVGEFLIRCQCCLLQMQELMGMENSVFNYPGKTFLLQAVCASISWQTRIRNIWQGSDTS